jgi:zinc protease
VINICSFIPARRHLAAAGFVLIAACGFSVTPAAAVPIERVVSPGGIEAWLVREPSIPLVSLEFAFSGGSAQDPADRPGVSHMVAELIDEGAADLDSRAFHEELEKRAIELAFQTSRDYFRGTLRTLNEQRDKAFDMLRLSLTAARFDTEPVERIRAQILSNLRRESTSPNDIASKRWFATAFPDHPYGKPTDGTLESVPQITVDDLRTYTRRVFARDGLKIAVVGDIDAATLGPLLDKVFGSLPAKADLTPVADVSPQGIGKRIIVPLEVPQAVITFGAQGLGRSDKDFMAAYIVNHILGGGTFSSRLYNEVREKRGLAYGVYTTMIWLKHTALLMGGTATRGDRTAETLQIIDAEIRRLAQEGPTADELEKAKSYLKGSYPLGLDTSTKIAGQLVQIQIDNLGIDYMDRRSSMIDAVTLADAKRVAKRLLDGGMLVTVVGKPIGLASSEGTGQKTEDRIQK